VLVALGIAPLHPHQGYEVMDTFVSFSSYIYDWIDMGCDRVSMHGALKQRVRPCPAHVACAWIDSVKDNLPFCPDDPNYVFNTIY
jgi:hypothetical protein